MSGDTFAARVLQAALAAGAALASATSLETGALRLAENWMSVNHFPALRMDPPAAPEAASVLNASRLHLLRPGATGEAVLRATFSVSPHQTPPPYQLLGVAPWCCQPARLGPALPRRGLAKIQTTTFFDGLGRPLWRPLLLLGDNAEMHPPAKLPTQLKLMVLTTTA